MTPRRTSLYSLRVRCIAPRVILEDLVEAMGDLGLPVYDQHAAKEDGARYAAVGFRAAGDLDALATSRKILSRAGLGRYQTELLTGHGVHRRTAAN